MDFKSKIREVQDYPLEGINFKDIGTLIHDGEAYHDMIEATLELVKDVDFDYIVGPEARGFIIGAPMSVMSKKGFIMVRKPGKIPPETISYEYELEYGKDVLEIYKEAIKPGDKILVADDLLATGGTAQAVCEMIESLGGIVVGTVFIIELEFLNGREKLEKYGVHSLVKY